jgi:two-component system response regulator FixJ
MTGHGDIPASVRAMKGGAVDFLEKPIKRGVCMRLSAALSNGPAGLEVRPTSSAAEAIAFIRHRYDEWLREPGQIR